MDSIFWVVWWTMTKMVKLKRVVRLTLQKLFALHWLYEPKRTWNFYIYVIIIEKIVSCQTQSEAPWNLYLLTRRDFKHCLGLGGAKDPDVSKIFRVKGLLRVGPIAWRDHTVSAPLKQTKRLASCNQASNCRKGDQMAVDKMCCHPSISFAIEFRTPTKFRGNDIILLSTRTILIFFDVWPSHFIPSSRILRRRNDIKIFENLLYMWYSLEEKLFKDLE